MNGTFFCSHCGAPNMAGAQFCTRCGASVQPAVISATTSAAIPSTVPVSPYPPLAPYASGASRGGVRYGGFWIRFVAAIIDGIIVQVIVLPLSFLTCGGIGVAGAMGGHSRSGIPFIGGAIGFVIGLGETWLCEAFMLSFTPQATLDTM